MEANQPRKNKRWTTGNVVSVIAVYFVNFLILTGMFVLAVYDKQHTLSELFADKHKFFSFIFLLLFAVSVIAIYFCFEDKDFLREASNSEMLFLVIEISLLVCYLIGAYANVYVRPIVLAAILTLFLTNSKTAVFTNSLFCIILFLFDEFLGLSGGDELGYPLFCLIVGIASGVIAIYLLRGVYSRAKNIVFSFIISAPVIIFILIPMVSFGTTGDKIIALLSGISSGPLAIMSFFLLLPIFEIIFKKVSPFRLAELTSHKSKFIRKMITETPGTFNHVIIVSNIAEMCATAIGEDALLARTCAYYHDMGKLRRPEFFRENQADGANPHDDLTPELSANIIRAHTQDGYGLALKSRLPKIIADVCREHHGTLPILYFYDKAKKFTDGDVPIENYCYAGPKPQSKIAAIIMIADGCEAAVRSLPDRSGDKVKEVVERIIADRMQLGQFYECDITLKELDIIKHSVLSSLTGVYHKRVEYPSINIVDKKTKAKTTKKKVK